MVYGTHANNYFYWGESKPTNITGGGHIVVGSWILPLKKITPKNRENLWISRNNLVGGFEPYPSEK